MRISEVLHSKGDTVMTITPETTVRDLVAKLAEHNLGAFVVSTDGTTVHGIVSERDVVRRLASGPEFLDGPVSDLMTAEVHSCKPDDHVASIRRLMTEHRIRHVPVVVDGHLAGIISIGDVVKSNIDELEFERDQLSNYVAGTQ